MSQIVDEFRAVLGRRYPGFVYRDDYDIADREVPVFVFHRIDPAGFGSALAYLRENGYHTATCDEYHDWITGRSSLPRRSVMLAIDDGHESVWQYGYPLLRSFDCRATVFLVSGYVRSRPRYFPHAGDVEDGRATAAELTGRDAGYYDLLYWEEIREMQDSGRVDFQSHSTFHHRVYVSPQLDGFFSADRRAHFFDWTVPAGFERELLDGSIEDRLGFPLFRSDSLFSSMRRFLDDPELREAMIVEAGRLGGRSFFDREPRWRAILLRTYRELSRGRPSGRLQEDATTRREIEENLVRSREIIESELRRPVRHFCFPYSLYHEDVMALVKKAGYRAAFIGTHPGRRTNRRGDDPFHTVRLKNDFLQTLPGRDRLRLTTVLAAKIRHRLGGEKVG